LVPNLQNDHLGPHFSVLPEFKGSDIRFAWNPNSKFESLGSILPALPVENENFIGPKSRKKLFGSNPFLCVSIKWKIRWTQIHKTVVWGQSFAIPLPARRRSMQARQKNCIGRKKIVLYKMIAAIGTERQCKCIGRRLQPHSIQGKEIVLC